MFSSTAALPEPRIAVVICTRDRPAALQETLVSVWSQARLPDELILIDDGHLPEDVRDRIAERCRELGIAGKFAQSAKRGLTASRNQAADLAQSAVLQYLDDDVTCASGFLAEIARVMRDPRVAGVTANVREPSFESRSARLYQLGYRLGGWWGIRPRGRPPGPPPRVLCADPSTPVAPASSRRASPDSRSGADRARAVVPARWLSGAAMALRRDLVREYRFDESLAEYALGEDREMGYRLAPHHWLVEARQAHVVHRREPGRRTDGRRLGFMTGYNYLHILNRTCRLGAGEWLLIGWSFAVLAAMHLVWAIVGDRRGHFAELRGLTEGLLEFWRVGYQRDGRFLRDDSVNHGLQAVRSARSRERLSAPSSSYGEGCLSHSGAARPEGRGSSTGVPPRRVLFITNRLEPGGAERMLLALVTRLRAHGVEPCIGCLQDAGPLAAECRAQGIPVFDHLLHFKTDAAVLLRLRRLLREQRINAIVVAHSGGDRMFWSTIAGRLARRPVVVWSHWFPVPPARHFERANRLLYRWVDAYVALGERHRQALIRHEFVPAGRITVIPNALDPAPFLKAPPRAEARQRLGLAEDDIAVAIIANLRREKRHDVFLRAARRLAADHPRLRFLVIGDGPHRDAVHAAAAASGLGSGVLRLLGPRSDIPALLPGIDISCLCSDLECFSLTMLEAAAAGCVFIGPESGCLPDFLEHRRTGLLIRPADVDSLTDAIRGLAADADLRRRLAEAAREKVTHGFDLNSTARAFAALLDDLVECSIIGTPRRMTDRER